MSRRVMMEERLIARIYARTAAEVARPSPEHPTSATGNGAVSIRDDMGDSRQIERSGLGVCFMYGGDESFLPIVESVLDRPG